MAVTSREPWAVDGVPLNTLGWNVAVTALTIPGRRGGPTQIPMRSGDVPTFNRPYEAAEFGLSMWVLGCDPDGGIPATLTLRRQMFDSNLEHLERLLTRDTGLLRFTKLRPDGTTLRLCDAQLTEAIGIDTMMARQRAEFQAVYRIPDVFWKDSADVTVAVAPSATLPRNFVLAGLQGTAPIPDALFTVQGAITNPRITDLETGQWVQYAGSLLSSDTWVVDSSAFTSKKNGSSVLAQTSRSGGARLLQIPTSFGPGAVAAANGTLSAGVAPTLQLTGTGGSSTTNLTVTGRRRWLTP